MAQLKMVYLKEFGCPDEFPIPEGFSFVPFTMELAPQYYQLRIDGGFTSPWDDEAFKKYEPKLTPNGLILVKHIESGRLVAAASAEKRILPLDPPFDASLGWVIAHPDFRGKKLGKLVCTTVTRKLIVEGYAKLVLSTDDFRIPAIATYLNIGWLPWLYEPDMQERWQNVLKTLNRTNVKPVELPPNNPWENYPTTLF